MPAHTLAITDCGLLHDLPRLLSRQAPAMPPAAASLLQERAASALKTPPLSVTHKTALPPSGNPHDYQSVGPYWWPNPDTANGLPYVRHDGQVHSDYLSDRYDTQRLERLGEAVSDLTLAWLVGRDKRMAAHAAMLLRTWFLEPATRMNPNLLFGQSIPGVCTGRGIGLIDTARFARMLDFVLLLHHAGALTTDEMQGLRDWFTSFLDWMLTHEYGIRERQEHNNHATWCDVQLASYALLVGREELAQEVITGAVKQRIFAHIEPDGRQPHELARTRSFSYSCYNLIGLFSLASLAERLGVDLWNCRSDDGRCLRGAMDFLAPYAKPSRAWGYPQISTDTQANNPALGQSVRAPLYPLLRHAAVVWKDGGYLAMAEKHPSAGQDYAAWLLW